MLSKFEIALKECSETEGWLQLLFNTNGIDEETYKNYRNPCGRIRRMLISSWKVLKTLKEVYKNARFTASVSRAFSSFTGESGDTEFTIAICMYLGSGKSGKSGIYHKPLRKKYMLRRAKHGNPCPNIPDFSSDYFKTFYLKNTIRSVPTTIRQRPAKAFFESFSLKTK